MEPGLQKRETRRIENAASRSASFRKRRRGLLKKAEELSILCDASVGVVIFSETGNVVEYPCASDTKMIIERYKRFLGHKGGANINDILEVTELHRYNQVLEKEYRQMCGEDLGAMNLRELQELEDRLDLGLKRIQSRQCELYNEQMFDISCKGLELVEENTELRQQLKASLEREEADAQYKSL